MSTQWVKYKCACYFITTIKYYEHVNALKCYNIWDGILADLLDLVKTSTLNLGEKIQKQC